MNSPCARIFTFQTSAENCVEQFCFGTGEKENRLEGNGNQSTFEGAVTEWAKALRLPRTAAAGRSTKTRDRCANQHESSCHPVLSGFLMMQYLLPVSTAMLSWMLSFLNSESEEGVYVDFPPPRETTGP